MIKLILEVPTPPPDKSQFQFEMTTEAAIHNWSVLQEYENLGEALQQEKNSPLKYGSEFRTPRLLKHIFKHHPLWPRLEKMLENGVDYPLEEVDTETRYKDTVEALEFGNHKGAESNRKLFESLMEKDITHGYSLVIPIEAVLKIENALMSPLNVQDQWTISEFGEVIPSKRLTHNQSKTYKASGTSVNSRVKKDKLQDCMYGHMIIRIIHYVIALREKYPKIVIFLGKMDYKSAYRRAHLNWKTAIQTITKINDDLAQIALRATFGGAPNPNEWGNVSETVCDLANAIMNDPNWDPAELHSPFQNLVPEDKKLDETVPFATALPTIVSPPLATHAWNDVYIDDDVTVNLDTPENTPRARAGVLLAMHVIGRLNSQEEPIKRLELPSMSKLAAEGALEEEKVVLGWLLNTRELLIKLPPHKAKAWSDSIHKILNEKSTTYKELQTLIGRLTHLSVVMQMILHFLSRLRHLEERGRNRRTIAVPDDVQYDLHLALEFVSKVEQGISFNLVTFRKPNKLYRADACPWSIGGHNHEGRAWRFEIPIQYLFRATLNMLEHLASVIGPWIDIIENKMPELSCTLSLTDSTTSCGWMKRSNFIEKGETKLLTAGKREVSRGHASRYLKYNLKDYTQWLPGEDNGVSDSLSRDTHLDPKTHAALLKQFFPQETPPDLEIKPLPKEIESWICAWLQKLPEGTPSQEIRQRSSIVRGQDGKDFLSQLESSTTHTSKISLKAQEQESSQSLHNQSVMQSTVQAMIGPWHQRLADQPWTMWHRPLGICNSQTQDTTQQASLAAFYNDSTKATKTRIRQRNEKKQHQ